MAETIKVSVSNFSSAVEQLLLEYSKSTAETINKCAKKVTNDSVKKLKASNHKRSGDYAKDWAVKATTDEMYEKEFTVYNRTHYQLTHLLEKGHRIFRYNGKGKPAVYTGKSTKGDNEIERVSQEATKEFEKLIEENLRV